MKPGAVLSWSSGKDSAFALHVARQDGLVEISALLTTVNEVHERVAIHGVRREVLKAQAASVGLPLIEVPLPSPCSNEVYEARMAAALARLTADSIRDVVFGDIYLEDVRAYREAQLARAGMQGHFPIWGRETRALAHDMLRAGTVAYVATLDTRKLPRSSAGTRYDEHFLASLSASVDPCGESGEFHTVVSDGPEFSRPVPLVKGKDVERDGFVYTDFSLAAVPAP